MIIRAYLPYFLNPLIFGACTALGIVTFGTPLLFETIEVVTLGIVIIACRKHIDITSVAIILIASQIAMTGYFSLYSNSLIYKAIGYASVGAALFYLRGDRVSRVLMCVVVACVIAEAYWFTSDYSAPQLFFILYKAAVYMSCRFAFVYRPHFINKKLNLKAHITSLDNSMVKIHSLAVYVQCILLLEYLVRHITPASPLYAYNAYEYVMHALGVWVFYLITSTVLVNKQKSRLTA